MNTRLTGKQFLYPGVGGLPVILKNPNSRDELSKSILTDEILKNRLLFVTFTYHKTTDRIDATGFTVAIREILQTLRGPENRTPLTIEELVCRYAEIDPVLKKASIVEVYPSKEDADGTYRSYYAMGENAKDGSLEEARYYTTSDIIGFFSQRLPMQADYLVEQ